MPAPELRLEKILPHAEAGHSRILSDFGYGFHVGRAPFALSELLRGVWFSTGLRITKYHRQDSVGIGTTCAMSIGVWINLERRL